MTETAALPLCVPLKRRAEARQAGAVWDARSQRLLWPHPRSSLAETSPLVRWLPRRYRLKIGEVALRPWMVPQPLWGWNLRALLAKPDWDVIRRAAYARSGYCCHVCGEQGPNHPVEADEGWSYDDQTRCQRLAGVVALCPSCHAVRHWGRTEVMGRRTEALRWLCHINQWSVAQAEDCVAQAITQWRQRSRQSWRCDVSWVAQHYGYTLVPDGVEKARDIQRGFEEKARMG
ncbi:HNH endonuclease [Neokomagataea thailandica]|nr:MULTISPECIES: hypothetical protein [Neokomagataea]